MQILNGNLFDSEAKYICHQCNCVTNRAAHLAKDVFAKYAYANVYNHRPTQCDPPEGERMGDIIIRGNGEDQRYVIAMLAQYYPGISKFPEGSRDGNKRRHLAFVECLDKIAEIPDLHSVAFPYGIGCGAAGSDWTLYLQEIQKFSTKVDATVTVLRIA